MDKMAGDGRQETFWNNTPVLGFLFVCFFPFDFGEKKKTPKKNSQNKNSTFASILLGLSKENKVINKGFSAFLFLTVFQFGNTGPNICIEEYL